MPLEEFCAINTRYSFGLWLFKEGPDVVEVRQSFTEVCSCMIICRLQLQEKEETKARLRPSKGRNYH